MGARTTPRPRSWLCDPRTAPAPIKVRTYRRPARPGSGCPERPRASDDDSRGAAFAQLDDRSRSKTSSSSRRRRSSERLRLRRTLHTRALLPLRMKDRAGSARAATDHPRPAPPRARPNRLPTVLAKLAQPCEIVFYDRRRRREPVAFDAEDLDLIDLLEASTRRRNAAHSPSWVPEHLKWPGPYRPQRSRRPPPSESRERTPERADPSLRCLEDHATRGLGQR